MELAALLLLLPFLLAGLIYLGKHRADGGDSARRLPPAPSGLPVIGNQHQVGALPHRALRALAAAHGAPHLLRLRLGRVPALVASSPRRGRHNPMREREVAALVKAVAAEAFSSAASAVDVSGALYRFANDVICRVVCGRVSGEEDGRSELFRELIQENTALLGGFCVGDFFPVLAWADKLLSGGGARAWRNLRRWDELLERMVQEHEERRTGRGCGDHEDDGEEDFVDAWICIVIRTS